MVLCGEPLVYGMEKLHIMENILLNMDKKIVVQ